MAFLKLRDQVGEGRRGGIAPTGEGGRKEGGRAGQRCGPPGRPLGGVAAREAGCRPGDCVERPGWGPQATLLSAKPGRVGAHVPLGGSPLPPRPREGRVPRSPLRRPRPARCRLCAFLSCQVRLGPNRWLPAAGRSGAGGCDLGSRPYSPVCFVG